MRSRTPPATTWRVSAVTLRNSSTVTGVPGKPGNLTATRDATNPGTQIDLAWEAPSDTGASEITGYRIERSADGNAPWMELVADTGNDGR